jgi:hypothetical protein
MACPLARPVEQVAQQGCLAVGTRLSGFAALAQVGAHMVRA